MFLFIAYDYPDAFERRLACRQAHVDMIDKLKANNKILVGAALLDDNQKMHGSILMLNMDKAELENYLAEEPYITNRVWEKWEIKACMLGPSFQNDKL